MPQQPSENRFPVSAQALRSLGEHHIIISSENGTLYKFKQTMLPELGKPIENPTGPLKKAVEILDATSGGPIEATDGSEKEAYYALNCKAFHDPRPSHYTFGQPGPEPTTPELPKHDFVIIPAHHEGDDPQTSDRTVNTVWLVEREALEDHRWVHLDGSGEDVELENEARQYVLNTLQHGIGVGLYPAVQLESGGVFIFCYIINCRCFEE